MKTPSKVAYTVKAVSSLKRTSDFPPQYNDLFKDGITSGVFEGNKSELSGEIDIPVSISGRVNPQKLTVTLGNSNYYIGSIKLSARGTRSEETSTAPLNWSQTLVGGSSTSYIYTIALTDYLAWENLVVEVVVKDRTASQSRKNARKLETESELLTETVTEPQTETAVSETEPQTNTTEITVPETTATESPTTETTAPETQIPETELPQTQAPETSAPETTAPVPQTEQPASETAAPQPETPAPQAETSAPETSAPQKETSAPPQPVEPQTADTQAAEHAEAEQDSGNP